MNIKHKSICKDTDAIAKLYSEKEGVPIKYVLTSDLLRSDDPVDIFYRDTPHPKFGNHYFGICFKGDVGYICDADIIEGQVICCVNDDEGMLQYSESHHTYKRFKNGNMIDGGRLYYRYSGIPVFFEIKNGSITISI
jgi:hypothetical protein